MVVLRSQKWAYVRIITGTILGGILGFYVMDRMEKSYKVRVFFFFLNKISVWLLRICLEKEQKTRIEKKFFLLLLLILDFESIQAKMNERLKKYESELKKREEKDHQLEESLQLFFLFTLFFFCLILFPLCLGGEKVRENDKKIKTMFFQILRCRATELSLEPNRVLILHFLTNK